MEKMERPALCAGRLIDRGNRRMRFFRWLGSLLLSLLLDMLFHPVGLIAVALLSPVAIRLIRDYFDKKPEAALKR